MAKDGCQNNDPDLAVMMYPTLTRESMRLRIF